MQTIYVVFEEGSGIIHAAYADESKADQRAKEIEQETEYWGSIIVIPIKYFS